MELSRRSLAAVALALAAAGAAAENMGQDGAGMAPGPLFALAMPDGARTAVERAWAQGAVESRLVALRAKQGEGSSPRDGAPGLGAGERRDRLRRGVADPAGGSWWGEFGRTGRQDRADGPGHDAETGQGAITGGVDYRVTPALVGGVALSWARSAGRPQRHPAAAGNWGVSAYASFTGGDWYVDGQVGFARLGYQARADSQLLLPFGLAATARGNSQGNQWAATVGAGYDLHRSTLTLSPYGRMSYVKLKLDSFIEREAMADPEADFGARSMASLQSALGVRLSTAMRQGERSVTPYMALEWNRELRSDGAALTTPYTPDPFTTFLAVSRQQPARDFFTLSVGLASDHRKGLSAFAKLDTILGLDRKPGHAFMVGVRGVF